MSKSIFITGASSGLGLAHAVYLTSKGYNVIGTSRYAHELELNHLKEVFIRDHTKYKFIDKEKIQLKGGRVLLSQNLLKNLDSYLETIQFIDMDITDDESVTKTVDNVGKIDVLINNAGAGYFGPIEDLSMTYVKNQFDINVFGTLRVLKAFIPPMRVEKQGQIINTTSIGAIVTIPFQAHYSASKAALLRLTEGLRHELKPFNIKVSALVPGDINTAFNAKTVSLHDKKVSFTSQEIKNLKDNIPTSEKSVYFPRAKPVWDVIIQNLIVTPPPIIVSKKVEKIIKAKNPKVHYKVGSPLQTYGVTFIKRCLSENLSHWILGKFYGL